MVGFRHATFLGLVSSPNDSPGGFSENCKMVAEAGKCFLSTPTKMFQRLWGFLGWLGLGLQGWVCRVGVQGLVRAGFRVGFWAGFEIVGWVQD